MMIPGRSARGPAVSWFTDGSCRVLVGVVAATLLMAQIAEAQTDGSAAPASDGIQCRTYFGMVGTAMDLSPPANDSLSGLREDEFPAAETANCATECTRGTYRGVCEVLTFNATTFVTTPEPRGPSGLPPGVIVGTTEGTCGYWSLEDDTGMGVDNLEFRPYSFMSICPPPGDNVGTQFFRPIDNRFIDLAVGPTVDMPCTLKADAFLWGVRFRDLEDGYSLRECAEICAADPFCSHVNYFINIAAGEDGFQRSGRCNYMQTLDLSDPLSGSIESVNTELYYTCWKDEYTDATNGETVVVDSFAVNGRLNSMTIDARPTPAPTAAPTPAPTAPPTPPIVVVAPSSDSDSGSSVGIAVGASVGAVVVLAVIVGIVFHMRKKRDKATKAGLEDLHKDDDSQLELASVPAFRLLSAHEAYAPLMQSKAVGYERLATVAPNTLVTQSFSALPSVHDAAHISTKDLRMHSYDDSAVLSTDVTSSTLSVDAPSTLKDLLSDPGSRDALLKQEGAQSMLMVYQLRCQLNTMTEAMKAYPHLFSTEVVVDAPDVQLAGGPWKAPNHLSVVDTTAPMKKLMDQLDEIPEDAVDRAELSSSGMLSSGLEPASSDFNSAISEPGMNMELVDPKMARKLKIMTKLMPVMPDVNLAVDPKHDFQYVRKLGRGAFATVWEAYWTARDGSRKHVAVKIMDLDELSSQKASRTANMKVVKTEMEIMTRINHPGIVRCYGGCVRSDMACLVLEFMEGGELAKFVHKERRGEPLSAGEVLSVGAHVGRALAFLHPLIIHADLKPQNILLDSEGHLKLTDFGLSKIKVATMMSSKLGGTPAYTAPEVFGNTKVTEKCDIYSLGVLMWECLTGEHPWSHLNYPLQIMYEVHTKNMRPPIPPECSEELASIIRKCWHADVNERPSATELLHRISIAQAALDL